MGRQARQQELFNTVSRGFDKEQVQQYLREMMENHACQQEQLQEQLQEREQAAAQAQAESAELRQELGGLLYDLQNARKELERRFGRR